MTREEAARRIAEKLSAGEWGEAEEKIAAGEVLLALREFERATLQRAAQIGDALSAAYIAEAKKFEPDEPGNPRAQFAAWSTGARDTARGIRALIDKE